MKKSILVALIAATALAPFAAGAQEWQGRRGREVQQTEPDAGPRPDRPQGPRGDGGDRPQRPLYTPQRERGDAPPPQPRPDFQPRPGAEAPRFDRGPRAGGPGGNGGDWTRGAPRPDAASPPRPGDDVRRGWSDRGEADRRRFEDARRNDRRDWDRRGGAGVGDNWGRNDWSDRNAGRQTWGRQDWGRQDWGRQDWSRNERARGGWDRDWRRDDRYDWQSWRSRNRSAYRLPRYYPPSGYGYGYQRFGIGVQLGSVLFSQNYWIDDPWTYRLPPADGPYRWVRYYNDALLVDVRYGEVIDVIHDIFW